MSRILILGDGLLGTEIRKQTGWDYISRKKDGIDFTNINSYWKELREYEEVVNCIGFTKTYSQDRHTAWGVNVMGTAQLVDFCETRELKLTHISTDYVYANSVTNASEYDIPSHSENWYSYTKLISDAYVQLCLGNHLLIRTSFKPRPFPHEIAYHNLKGNFDYVDVIAGLIIKLIEKGSTGVYNVGTEPKTMYELALQTNPDVKKGYGKFDPSMPEDVTMDIGKMKKELGL